MTLAKALREVADSAPAILRAKAAEQASELIKKIVSACKEEATKAAEVGQYYTTYWCDTPYISGIAWDDITNSIVSGLMIEGFKVSATIDRSSYASKDRLNLHIDWGK